jgi:small GTP-binding protein
MDNFIKSLISSIRNRKGVSLLDALERAPEKHRSQFNKLVDEELSIPPKIAIIGKTGVGKSSTINALFGTSLAISHTRSCTKLEELVKVEKGPKSLVILDMPGLLEDIDADARHIETYRRVIPMCDVAVWILDAADRAIAEDQRMIRDVVGTAKPELLARLVIGLNKIDDIQPGAWLEDYNVPSKRQKESIVQRITDVTHKLLKVCPELLPEQIVPYSATKRYRLTKLRNAMEVACPLQRIWVLRSRENLASFSDLVHPAILAGLKSRKTRK